MATQPAPQHTIPTQAPSMLFQGYDSVQHSEREAAVSGTFHRESGEYDCKISVCESLTEVANAFEIHSSLSVSYLAVASVNASMDFVKSLKIGTRNLAVVVRARRWGDVWKSDNVKLLAGNKAPSTSDEAAAFARSYGDCYVDSVTLGGEYCGVYVFRTETKSEQETLSASLKAHGLFTGVSVDASVQTKLSNFLSSTNTTYTFDHTLRGVNATMPASQADMIAFALGFSALPLTDPAILRYSIKGYEEVAAFGEAFYDVVDNREYFRGNPGGAKGLLDDRMTLGSVLNQAEWLQSVHDTYHYAGDQQLPAFIAGVRLDIESIDKQIKQYRRKPATAQTRPALPTLLKGTPVLKVKRGPIIGWGGSGGDPWNFPLLEDVIKDRVRIKTIRIGGPDYLERIEITYQGDTMRWTDIGGHKVNENYMSSTLTFGPDDVITRIAVRAGKFVDNLRIELSNGEYIQAGGSGGNAGEWSPKDGQFIVGFKGRLGGYVENLEIVSALLEPAAYVRH